jgi:hypothetical protein
MPRYQVHPGVFTKRSNGTWTEETVVYECTNIEDVDGSNGKIQAHWRIAQRILTKRFVRTKYRDDADMTIWDSDKPNPKSHRCIGEPKLIYLKRVK